MKKNTAHILTFCFALALVSASCTKKNNPSGISTVSQYNVNISLLINTWIKDDEAHNWTTPDPVHFYSGRRDVKIEFRPDHSYIYNYTSLPSNAQVTENGSWAYDENTRQLTFSPQAGKPYSYRIIKLEDEEQLWIGVKYTTYDNEGVANGSAEEVVHLEDND